jgi:hypothetical protein
MILDTLVDRAQAIRDTITQPNIKQRIELAAEVITAEAGEQMHVELLNESLLKCTELCYMKDETGRYTNIDARTYRILIVKPWSSGGWEKWTLRQWESRVMRSILITRSNMRRVPPLFDYAASRKQWYLNLGLYPSLDNALTYWKRNPITLADWHRYADILRERERGRKGGL